MRKIMYNPKIERYATISQKKSKLTIVDAQTTTGCRSNGLHCIRYNYIVVSSFVFAAVAMSTSFSSAREKTTTAAY